MELLVLRCHLKDPSQSILCYPTYLSSKGEGLSWSFWDWNLWFQGNLSILTLRSLLLSRSSSIWQVIFVEFCNLDPGPVPLWNVSSFCLLLKCIAHEVKYICFSVAVKPQEFWNLGDWNGIFKVPNVSTLIAFTWQVCLTSQYKPFVAVIGNFYIHVDDFSKYTGFQFLNFLSSNYLDHYPNSLQVAGILENFSLSISTTFPYLQLEVSPSPTVAYYLSTTLLLVPWLQKIFSLQDLLPTVPSISWSFTCPLTSLFASSIRLGCMVHP